MPIKNFKRLLHTGLQKAKKKPQIIIIAIGLIGVGALLVTAAAGLTSSIDIGTGNIISGSAKIISNDLGTFGNSSVQFGSGVSQNMNIYFGSTHTHTGCCNNHGSDKSTAREIFQTAKTNGYQFMFLTEHSGSSGPSSQGLNPATFFEDVKFQAAAVTDNTFVGFAGIEFSDNDTDKAHMTGVNQNNFLSADGANNSTSLIDYLVSERKAGRTAYGGYNHPGSGGHPGSATSRLNSERREVVVMSEVHNSNTDEAKDTQYFNGLVSELDRGWRVAPTCGVDGHGLERMRLSSWPEPKLCRTGVLATSLSRTALDDAFINRRIYSSSDANLQVRYKANGEWMGSIIGTPTSVNFDIDVSDPDTNNANDKITKIDIVTAGGAVAASQTFSSHSVNWKPSIPVNGRKYFFLRIFNAERSFYTAAAAPVWIEPKPSGDDSGNSGGGGGGTTSGEGMKVSGNDLQRDGQPFYAKGFNSIGILQPDNCPRKKGDPSTAAANFNQNMFNAMKNTWKANTIRLQVSQKGLDPQDSELKVGHTAYVNKVKAAVELARSNNMTVILSMQDQVYSCGYAHPLPSSETIRAWQVLAPIFKDNPYVMFELFNEPVNQTTDADWSQWRNGGSGPTSNTGSNGSVFDVVGHQQLLNTIRGLGANNVVFAEGANKGGKLQGLWQSSSKNYFLTDTLSTPQIGYAIHPYYFHIANNSTLSTDTANWDSRFGYMLDSSQVPADKQVPIIATEWNASANCFAGQAARTPEFLNYLKSKGIAMAAAHAIDIANKLVTAVPGWQPSSFTTGGSECATGSDGGQALKTFFENN